MHVMNLVSNSPWIHSEWLALSQIPPVAKRSVALGFAHDTAEVGGSQVPNEDGCT